MLHPFRFRRFAVEQCPGVHPVGTDGVLLGAWADTAQVRTVLDIGTGTGLIALMLAQRTEHLPDVKIQAVDALPAAAACAQANFSRSPWAGRLQVTEQRIQDFSQTTQSKFDLIVSNPPFFTETTFSPDPNRRRSRNAVALSTRDLLAAVAQLLSPKGRFCVVMPCREGQFSQEQAVLCGLYCTRKVQVYSRIGKPAERLLLQLERNPYPFERTDLVIHEQVNVYAEAFRELTDAFYANPV
ncbi:MAG: methyltransferase [Saprospiraceae bacterium]|nr:methyltransferase [Saprospiraceae bacterium]